MRDTAEILGWNARSVSLWAIYFIAYKIAAVVRLGLLGALTDVMDWLIAAALPTIAVLLSIFFLQLWLAPYRLLRDEIGVTNDLRDSDSEIGIGRAPVDSSEYARYPDFRLWEAASLWVNTRPQNPVETPSAEAKLGQLQSAIRCGQLQANWGNNFIALIEQVNGVRRTNPPTNQRVSAIELKRYAIAIDEDPEFLRHVDPPPRSQGIEPCQDPP